MTVTLDYAVIIVHPFFTKGYCVLRSKHNYRERETSLENTSDNKQVSAGIAKIGIMIAIVAVIALVAGVWYYFSQIRATEIEKIFSNPTAYTGKDVAIAGVVRDRTAIFGILKFYKIRDKSGEMIVVTRKSLPEIRSNMSVKGRIDNDFPLGDQKLVVFVEESIERKNKSK